VLEEMQIGLAAPAHFEKPNHIRIVGRHEFGRLVTEAGLVIERRGSYGFYWAVWWLMFWLTGVDIFDTHPLLQSWEKTWKALIDIPASEPLRRTLNTILPKSQYIVARKPSRRGRGAGFLRDGLRSIRTVLSGAPIPNASGQAARASNPAGLVDPAAPVSAVPVDDGIDSKTIGIHDSVESGWFKFDKGELFDGFSISPEDIVLDVGCGSGAYSATCARMGAHVIAVDINPDNVAEAVRSVAKIDGQTSFTPIVSDSKPLPLDDGSVTKVVALEVLEYADDPLAMLQELKRVGRPGARYLLAVSDPVQDEILRQVAPAKLFTKPADGDYFIRGVSRGQLHTIGRDEFERMVTAAGLVVERVHHVGFYWSLWFAFFWLCNVDFAEPRHPLLAQWARTWKMLLDMDDAHKVKQRLDAFMPKRQIIVAWKP
jgi:SAM-dependent methyltransferase